LELETLFTLLMNVVDMWLAGHTPVNTDPIIDDVLKHLEETYGEGKGYKTSHGIRVVGYCFGGKYALRLAARDDVKAVAVAHGKWMFHLLFQVY
jgi:dienelactone hydrolase